jgi:hypothetical protein
LLLVVATLLMVFLSFAVAFHAVRGMYLTCRTPRGERGG